MSRKAKKAEAETSTGATAEPKMKRKKYEKEMRRLQGELVAMQEWVKSSGAKVCIVFEGLDSAGKGGTIRRITERTSPRVFKHVALPTRPSARSRRCTSSATSPTSRRPARSPSSTAASTTAPASSR
jgi:polyphosphate kinase 2 (PPK2 family)